RARRLPGLSPWSQPPGRSSPGAYRRAPPPEPRAPDTQTGLRGRVASPERLVALCHHRDPGEVVSRVAGATEMTGVAAPRRRRESAATRPAGSLPYGRSPPPHRPRGRRGRRTLAVATSLSVV